MAGFERVLFLQFSPQHSTEEISVYLPDGVTSTIGRWSHAAQSIELDDVGADIVREWLLNNVGEETTVPTPVLVDLGARFDRRRPWHSAVTGAFRNLGVEIGVNTPVSVVQVTDPYAYSERLWSPTQMLIAGIDPSLDAVTVEAVLASDRVQRSVELASSEFHDLVDFVVVNEANAPRLLRSFDLRTPRPGLAFVVGRTGAAPAFSGSLNRMMVLPAKGSTIAGVLENVGAESFVELAAAAAADPITSVSTPVDVILGLSGVPGRLFDLMRDRAGRAGAERASDLVPDPFPVDDPDVPDQRRLDLEMRAGLVPIDRSARFGPRSEYSLAVRIGQQYEASLFDELPPPITPRLGDEDAPGAGWDLEVVVFGHDFEVVGLSSQSLHLPHAGASDELVFSLVAPSESTRPARFRVAVLRRDNLVMSCLCQWGADGIRARVDVQHIRDFAKAGELEGRSLWLATCASPSGEGHRLLATGSLVLDVPLESGILTAAMEQISRAFDDAGAKYVDGPQWFPDTRPGQVSPRFHAVSCELARAGNTLALKLFKEAPEAQKQQLIDFMKSAGGVIQTVRYDADFGVPWSLLYDWELPTKVRGQPEPNMCLGHNCGHDADSTVFCVLGFWGVRHIIEELDRFAPPRTKAPELKRPPAGSRLLVTLDREDGTTSTLLSGLSALVGSKIARNQAPKEALLDQLWAADPPTSAAVLIGHVSPGDDRDGWPESSYMVLREDPPEWLVVNDVMNHRQHDRNGAAIPSPGPLVLLLGCRTGGAVRPSLGTLPGDFLGAGAATVISTLCPIHAGFAADFGAELIAKLLTAQEGEVESVGQALLEWRRSVVSAGNPLALALVSSGEADLRFERVPM